jgi:CDP-diacylglycerol--glycerol-3-phosphate 3-phosphatidyltransferase
MSERRPRLFRRQRREKNLDLRAELWNIPNFLTYFRIAMIPVVVYMLYRCEPGADPTANDLPYRVYSFIATVIFGVAAATDFFDGWIARNFDMSTTVGKFMDPLADKLLVLACLVMMVHLNRVPAWFVILLLSRELSIISLRAIASGEGLVVNVAQAGKWKTAFQLCGLVGVLVHYEYTIDYGFVSATINFNRTGMLLLAGAMLFSIISAIQYFHRFALAASTSVDE